MENRGLFKSQVKVILFISFLLSFFYLALFYYVDSRNNLVQNRTCFRKGDDFTLSFRKPIEKEKFWILKLRAGQILIRTRQQVDSVELVTNENIIIKTDKINYYLFQKELKRDLIIRSVRLIPKSSSIDKVNVSIFRKPILSIHFIVYQFVFLFSIFGIGLFTASVLYSHILKRETMLNRSSKLLISMSIMLLLVLFIFFVVMLDEFMTNLYKYPHSGVLVRVVLFNISLAFFLISLFYLFFLKKQGELLPVYLPLLISAIFIFINLPFKTNVSGDCLLWVINLRGQASNISFAESLSLLLNKLFYHCTNLITHVSPKAILIYTGKLIGVLFIFSLFCLINSFREFSYKKKLLFFILFLTFSLNAMFFGFPDFAYYPLPFLIFSFCSARKYIQNNKHVKHLILSALLIVIAGFFHGSAFFSLPVILLFPILKDKKDMHNRGVRFYLEQYIMIFLTIGIAFSLYFISVKQLGFGFAFNTTVGGFDGRQFISFLPANFHFPQALNFIEISYFIFRGWIFFISGTFIFLLFLVNMKKIVTITRYDLILFLYGISQLLIVLFWDFDLGLRDFDLYIAPMTFIHLFFIKILLKMIRSDEDKLNAWKYILLFALFSPLYFFIIQVV